MKKSEYLKMKEMLDEQIAMLAERARANPRDASLLYKMMGCLVECNRALVFGQFNWPFRGDDD